MRYKYANRPNPLTPNSSREGGTIQSLLPFRREVWREVKIVLYWVENRYIGALISLSEKGVQLQSPHFLELLSNIKLKLLIEPKLATEEEHIYAKVI